MNKKQTILLPLDKDIPNIWDYPFPKIAKQRRVSHVVFQGEAISAAVGLSGNRVYRKEGYASYRENLQWLIKQSIGGDWNNHRYSFGIRVRFFLGNKRKIDIDNLLKPVLDAGTGLIWADDSQVIELYSFVLRSDLNPRVESLVYTIEEFNDYQRKGKEQVCQQCGKVYFNGRYHGDRKKSKRFCSRACYYNWVKEHGREMVLRLSKKPTSALGGR